MSIFNYSKLDIALCQLERALDLYLSASDYISAITLAGASEEILGKLLVASGKIHTLGEMVEVTQKIGKTEFKENINKKKIVSLANQFRDGLKHFGDGQSLTFDPFEAATEIIDRAIENYFKLTGKETKLMDEFKKSQLHKKR